MINYLNSKIFGRSKLGWLDSHFHFSFAEYYQPNNIQFGVLRVLNDDLIQPGTGFDTHPHRNMEIITYIVEGELTHADSMGNKETLSRGQVQYMSAGTGISHSEHNFGSKSLRLLQMWFLPDRDGYKPNYGDCKFEWSLREGQWMPVASGDGDVKFPIQIHADIHLYATSLKKDQTIHFEVAEGRQGYLVLIEGELEANGCKMSERDALEVVEENLMLQANTNAHILLIEMKKS